ncbi:MAG: A/G-specific adenine glycosylase, partial [Bacteroidota bacterium]
MSKTRFATRLVDWYQAHRRDLPWRKTNNPYHIWLSEVILQQTRVVQGLPYYQRFIEQYPTVQALAAAEEEAVLRLWQGLGYYSRARNLHACARMIVSEWGGEFPTTYQSLLQLKGVGKYTAAAVASIAFKEPVAVVDGNVYRVLSRVFGV